MSTVFDYTTLIANTPNVQTKTVVIHKTPTRYASEQSLRSLFSFLCGIAFTHVLLGYLQQSQISNLKKKKEH